MQAQAGDEALQLSFAAAEPPAGAARSSGAKPVVILPGLFGSKQNWRSLSRALAQRLGTTVVAVDLRNHGESPHHRVHNYAAMCGDVTALVESQGWGPAHVIGHSMGGKVAMHLALLPGHGWVDRLVVVDMPPVAQTAKATTLFAGYIEAMREVDRADVASPAAADAILQRTIPELAVRQFILTNLKRQADGSYRFRVNLDALAAGLPGLWTFDIDSREHTFGGPALFIAGGNSRYVTPEMHPAIRRYFPQATIQTIAGASHWVHADRPDEFVASVVAFLRA